MQKKVRKVDVLKRNPKELGLYDTDIGKVSYNGPVAGWVTSGQLGLPKFWYEEYTPKPRKKKK